MKIEELEKLRIYIPAGSSLTAVEKPIAETDLPKMCKGCFCENDSDVCLLFSCSPKSREDGKNVIFKLI